MTAAEDQPPLEPSFVPWGRTREAPAASFGADDFPALGSVRSAPRPTGRGRGRGACAEEDDEPNGNIKQTYHNNNINNKAFSILIYRFLLNWNLLFYIEPGGSSKYY